MMIQRGNERTIRSGKRVVLGALAASVVLGGLALHMSAEPTRADCLSINGSTITFGNGDGSCASTNVSGSAAVAQSGDNSSGSTLSVQGSGSTSGGRKGCPAPASRAWRRRLGRRLARMAAT